MDARRAEDDTNSSPAQEILDAAQNLAVDQVTREVVGALDTAGVRSILLKGPTFTSFLYRDGGSRPYADVDLLIAPATAHAARRVLDELGFRPLFDSSEYFVRALDAVDLHCSLKGMDAREEVLWETLSVTAVPHEVAGAQVVALSIPARALQVALHAAQHGPDWETPMEDLRRALGMLPLATWESAAALADELVATEAFATGLRLLPDGETLAEQLQLPTDVSFRTHLRAKSPPPLALGLEEMFGVEGFRARVRFVARKLFPSRSYMQVVSPIAGRGRFGLALAYGRRLVWLCVRAGPAILAWRRSRREIRRASASR
jgi:hypothetical protein